ncbi:VOC family protein [Kitasatospora acidiphila]|uniref:VOC family protein n=1 Tax=Kitasatospora acidiphila TaxID=2567942 RepID=A0A540W1R8_9ACTN|nr:VOC family protein [Kitasatospora acidiphila]TQF02970.1 VOC family protein [Kitasatospora acidiphila]
MTDTTAPVVDRTIYPMPMFASFKVADILAAEAFYHAVGFVSIATIPGPEGVPALVHLRRMKYQDILLVPGTASRGSVTVSFNAGGQDVAALATALRAAAPEGARIEGPTDTLWFTTDVTIDDPDGNRVIITAQREAEAEQAKAWAKENLQGDFIAEE